VGCCNVLLKRSTGKLEGLQDTVSEFSYILVCIYGPGKRRTQTSRTNSTPQTNTNITQGHFVDYNQICCRPMSVILRFRCPLSRTQTSSINATSVETPVPFIQQALNEDTSTKIQPCFTIGVVEFVNKLSFMHANAAVSLQFTVIMRIRQFAPPIRHLWWGSLT